MNKYFKQLVHELKHHLPFTASATIIAVVISVVFIMLSLDIGESIFHSLHILHLLASAIVTSAIFYKYKKSVFQTILVGISGAIIVGSLSDIIFPWLGASIFQLNPHFHLSIIEIPFMVLGTAFIGSLIGIMTLATKLPHTLHVGISVFASMFYLITYVETVNVLSLILSFIIVVISVMIPCCVSDILYPFFFLGKKIKRCDC